MSTKRTTTNNFVATVLRNANKTKEELQKESVENFVAESTIEIELQIGQYEGRLKKEELELKRAENSLAKAQKDFEAVRYSVATNFEAYLNNRTKAVRNVDKADNLVTLSKMQIEDTKITIDEFKKILNDFK